MENEQKKKGNNIIIVVLVVIVLGLISFIVYDKVLSKKGDKSTNNPIQDNNQATNDKEDNQSVDNNQSSNDKDDNSNVDNNNKNKEEQIQDSTDKKEDIVQNTDNSNNENECTNSYSEFANNVIKGRTFSSYYRIYNRFYDSGIDYVELDENSDVKLHFNNQNLISKYGQDYVVTQKALSVYNLEHGNGGLNYIMIIKDDGSIDTVNFVSTSTNSLVVKNNIGNLKNIVSLTQTSAYMDGGDGEKSFVASSIIAIDFYGNIKPILSDMLN